MANAARPMRRVVTGHDAEGRSCVVYDSATPNTLPRFTGTCFYEFWTIDAMPEGLEGTADGGAVDRRVILSPPLGGAHLRIVYSAPDRDLTPEEKEKERVVRATTIDEGRVERRPGARHHKMHRTPSVDYAWMCDGDRYLVLEDVDVKLNKGDFIIQLGNWHSWEDRHGASATMGFVMIDGEFG